MMPPAHCTPLAIGGPRVLGGDLDWTDTCVLECVRVQVGHGPPRAPEAHVSTLAPRGWPVPSSPAVHRAAQGWQLHGEATLVSGRPAWAHLTACLLCGYRGGAGRRHLAAWSFGSPRGVGSLLSIDWGQRPSHLQPSPPQASCQPRLPARPPAPATHPRALTRPPLHTHVPRCAALAMASSVGTSRPAVLPGPPREVGEQQLASQLFPESRGHTCPLLGLAVLAPAPIGVPGHKPRGTCEVRGSAG